MSEKFYFLLINFLTLLSLLLVLSFTPVLAEYSETMLGQIVRKDKIIFLSALGIMPAVSALVLEFNLCTGAITDLLKRNQLLLMFQQLNRIFFVWAVTSLGIITLGLGLGLLGIKILFLLLIAYAGVSSVAISLIIACLCANIHNLLDMSAADRKTFSWVKLLFLGYT